jgi:preprotein translocase subunit YajC
VENLFLTAWILFAEGEGGAPAPAGNVGDPITQMLLLFVPLGLLFWFFIWRPQRKEAARRQEMLRAVKKNDRVVTIGGIHGVVTNVQSDKGKLTIRVDENTKLEMLQSAIARVVVDGESDDK